VESVLDKVRDGEVDLDSDLAGLFLESCDQISALVDNVASGNDAPDARLDQTGAELIQRLNVHLGVESFDAAEVAQTVAAVEMPSAVGGAVAETDHWHISLRFGTDVFRNGMDPLAFMRYLRTLGDIVSVTTITAALPALAALEAGAGYLGFGVGVGGERATADV